MRADPDLQSKLIMHYRRMVVHELGLAKESEIARFENLCRHAHIQVEGLFSFFYKEKFRCIAPQFIAEYNRYVDEINNRLASAGVKRLNHMATDKSWSRITFAEKNLLFEKYTLDSSLSKFLKLLNNFRNSISHIGYVNRNSEEAISVDEKVRDFKDAKNLNAVLDALLQTREYVEYNII